MNPKKVTPRYFIVKLLSTKYKRPLKKWENLYEVGQWRKQLNDSRFPIWNYGDQKELAYFKHYNHCLLRIPYLVKIFFRMKRKSRRGGVVFFSFLSPIDLPKGMAKGSTANREGKDLERTSRADKTINFPSSWAFRILFEGWYKKNYNWCGSKHMQKWLSYIYIEEDKGT